MSNRTIPQDLSPKEAAVKAQVCLSTIYRWIYSDLLPYYKTGSGLLRIKEEDLRSFLAGDRLKAQDKGI